MEDILQAEGTCYLIIEPSNIFLLNHIVVFIGNLCRIPFKCADKKARVDVLDHIRNLLGQFII